jgi:hypothetical protein
MRRSILSGIVALALLVGAGCEYYPDHTNLREVQERSGLKKVTTGSADIRDYTPVGRYAALEFGLAFGFPFSIKFKEIFPVQRNETLLWEIAQTAEVDDADAMIDVEMKTVFTGFPLLFIGLYWDRVEGTGIRLNNGIVP